MRTTSADRTLLAGDAAPLCKRGSKRAPGDEVGDNGTRLPAPSLDVRGLPACANIARAGTVPGPDKAAVSKSRSVVVTEVYAYGPWSKGRPVMWRR